MKFSTRFQGAFVGLFIILLVAMIYFDPFKLEVSLQKQNINDQIDTRRQYIQQLDEKIHAKEKYILRMKSDLQSANGQERVQLSEQIKKEQKAIRMLVMKWKDANKEYDEFYSREFLEKKRMVVE